MASPFHVFRKNQKAMIATLGLLAIGAFVFLTPIAMYHSGSWGGGDGGDNPVVVTTKKYGDLTQRDINIMQGQKRRLLEFFSELVGITNQDNYQAMMMVQNRIQQLFGDTSEEAVVNTWLLAQIAKEQGMEINDMVVADFINAMTFNKATPDLIRKIQNNKRLTEDALFDLLQQELLAQNLQNSFTTSLFGITPGQRWNYFQRLNRKVSAQVSPVEVADFVAEVPDPTEKELKAFFEKHKNTIPAPSSPTPGFRVPQMADVEFIKADYDQFAAPDAVTDKEIEQYYLANRDHFKIIDLPGLPEDMMNLETPSMLRGLKEGLNTKAPAEETSATEAPAAEKSATEKPAEAKKQDEAPKASDAEKAEEKTSSVARSVFHLVSMQEEKAEDAAPEKDAAPKKPADAEPAPEKPAPEKPAPEKPAPEKPAETEAKAEETKEPAKTPATTISPATIGTGLSELDNSMSGAPTISGKSYKPLEEVKDEIRHTLAIKKARERMEEVLGKAKKEIKKYNDKLAISDTPLSDEETNERLSQFLKELAEKNKLTYGKTGLLSAPEIYKTEVGKATVKDVHQPVAALIISRMNDQQLRTASDLDQNYYLFWRVQKTEEKTPELTDEGVREKVTQAWKQFKARELAKKEAERLAKEAKESGQSLRNSIGKSENVPVKSTGEFSWFRHQLAPGIGQTLGLGRPENVDMVGRDFMKAVYELHPKEVTVVMNYPETIAYVVQLTDTTPDPKTLWTVFKNDNFANYADIARDDLAQVLTKWMQGLQDEAGLDWERPAIRPSAQQR